MKRPEKIRPEKFFLAATGRFFFFFFLLPPYFTLPTRLPLSTPDPARVRAKVRPRMFVTSRVKVRGGQPRITPHTAPPGPRWVHESAIQGAMRAGPPEGALPSVTASNSAPPGESNSPFGRPLHAGFAAHERG